MLPKWRRLGRSFVLGSRHFPDVEALTVSTLSAKTQSCTFGYPKVKLYDMANKVKKRMGRPPVGSTLIGVKVPPTQLARLKAWIKTQPDKPTLPEALRRLADKAMDCAEKTEARTT